MGFRVSVRDITERKRVEKELAEHRDHLEDLVRERAGELQSANAELRSRTAELESFTRLAIGREKRMIKLKQEINELLKRAGAPPRYRVREHGLGSAQGGSTD